MASLAGKTVSSFNKVIILDSEEFYKVSPRRNNGNNRAGGSTLPVSHFFIYRCFVCRVTSIPQHRSSGLFLGAIGL
jgi:hypothetical protein